MMCINLCAIYIYQMGKWEACIQECETLMKETPENEEVGQMIKDAQQQLAQERRN